MNPHASDDSTARVTHPYQGHYMEPAFLGFVSFASKNLMAQFEAECGKVKLGTSPIERMIDMKHSGSLTGASWSSVIPTN